MPPDERKEHGSMSKHGLRLLWSFVATLFLTGLLSASQGLGLTRMNIPYMLGTMLTPDRDRAKLSGFFLHFLNGWGFAFLYTAAFESWRRSGWWRRAAAARAASAHGQRAARPYADAPARAARLHGPELRRAHAAFGHAGPHRLWRDPGCLLQASVVRIIVRCQAL